MSDYFFAPERYHDPAGRFVVRRFYPGDGALVAEAVNSSYDHLKQWMPWATPTQTAQEAEARVRRSAGDYVTNVNFTLGVFTADERRILGGTGYHLRGRPYVTLDAEIGMWIRSSAAGQGLGTAVLSALLRWGFTAWQWERLEWHCDSANLASARTAEKAGMVREVVWRQNAITHLGSRCDTAVYGMLRGDWLAANPA